MHLVADGGCAVWDEVRVPALLVDTDAIVRVDAMTRDVVGRRNVVGTVEAIGRAVSTIDVGDRVLVPAVKSCGHHTELMRVPLADTSTCKVPDGVTDGEILSIATFLRVALVPNHTAVG